MKLLIRCLSILWIAVPGCFCPAARALELEVVKSVNGVMVRILDGKKTVFSPISSNAGLVVMSPEGRTPVHYAEVKREEGAVTLSGGSAAGLSITETFRPVQTDLIERVVRVTANSDQRFFLELGWQAPQAGDFYSFVGKETATQQFSLSCAGPEFAGQSKALHTFPCN